MNFKLAQNRARALFELGKGAAIQTAIIIYLLFETDLGEGMPDGIKIDGPIMCWIPLNVLLPYTLRQRRRNQIQNLVIHALCRARHTIPAFSIEYCGGSMNINVLKRWRLIIEIAVYSAVFTIFLK